MRKQATRTIGHGLVEDRQINTEPGSPPRSAARGVVARRLRARAELALNTRKTSMETTIETIRDQQRDTWNKFSAGWKKWDHLVLPWLAPLNGFLLEAARLEPTSQVLD